MENQNPLKLSRFHLVLVLVYAILLGLLGWLFWPGLPSGERTMLVAACSVPSLVHETLAWGTRLRREWTRKCSVVIA